MCDLGVVGFLEAFFAAEDAAGDGETAFDDGMVGEGLLWWFGHFGVAWVFRAESSSVGGGGECADGALWTSPAAEGS